jgi:hypothetical protein
MKLWQYIIVTLLLTIFVSNDLLMLLATSKDKTEIFTEKETEEKNKADDDILVKKIISIINFCSKNKNYTLSLTFPHIESEATMLSLCHLDIYSPPPDLV